MSRSLAFFCLLRVILFLPDTAVSLAFRADDVMIRVKSREEFRVGMM